MDLVRGKDLLWILEEVRQQRVELGPRSETSSEPLRRAVGRRAGGDHHDLLGDRSHARCVARIARLIALTLEHAHGAGVIHRDLKPQNVMLVPGGEPVLLDFGLASWGQEGSEEGFRGTPEYMAPEQIERMRAGTDPRTDVYQLGLLLYEMLALRRAFSRKSREELWPLFERIQNGATEPLSSVAAGVPRALAAIVEKAAERDPARRYQTMRALREDLDRFLTRLPPKEVALPPAVRAGMHVDHALHQPFTAVVGALGVAALLWAREPAWVPPDIALLKVEAGRVDTIEDGQPIELEEPGVLGLEVKAESPSWLYVFQLFGASEEGKEQRLRPIRPASFEDYATRGGSSDAQPIEVGRGSHRLACADLLNTESYEGLLVCASPRRNEVLDEWQRTLHEQQVMNGVPVTYEEARSYLEMLAESLRGDALGTLSKEQLHRVFGELNAAEKGHDAGLERSRDERFYYLLRRVERKADRAGG
jgi:hypothetical protein